MIFSWATLVSRESFSTVPAFDRMFLSSHSREDTRTKLALCLTSKAVKAASEEFLYRYVSVSGDKISKLARLIRYGAFDATKVKELRLVSVGRAKGAMASTLPSATKIIKSCIKLESLDMSCYHIVCEGRMGGLRLRRLHRLWSAMPPSLKTISLYHDSIVPFKYDDDLTNLVAFTRRHLNLQNWSIGSFMGFNGPDLVHLLAKTRALALRYDYHWLRGEDIPKAFQEVEILSLTCFVAPELRKIHFPKLKEVHMSNLWLDSNFSRFIGGASTVTSLDFTMETKAPMENLSIFSIHPQKSRLQYVVLRFPDSMFVRISWLRYLFPLTDRRMDTEEGIDHTDDMSRRLALTGLEDAKKEVKQVFGGLTDRTSFPQMEKVTLVCKQTGWNKDGLRTHQVLAEMFGFFNTDGIQFELRLGEFSLDQNGYGLNSILFREVRIENAHEA